MAFAQDVGVTGAELLAGAGDAKLAALGRQAADTGKRVVVSAPDYWHDKVAQKILAGAHGTKIDLVMKDSFVEAVVVRLADKTADSSAAATTAKPVPAPAPVVAPTPKPVVAATPAPAAKPVVVAEPPKPAVPVITPAPAPVQKVETAPAPMPEPVAVPAPVAVASAPAPVAAPPSAPIVAAPAVDQTTTIRKELEKTLNDGNAADGSLSVAQLDIGDQIYVDGNVRAVVRRKGTRQLFWLDGELNLLRTELAQLSKSSYEVKARINENAPPILRTARGITVNFSGKVPAPTSAERISLEKQLNDAHTISETIEVNKLQSNDLIYLGSDSAVVARRSGATLLRYWLVGDIDLGQRGVTREGNGRYRVVSDTLK